MSSLYLVIYLVIYLLVCCREDQQSLQLVETLKGVNVILSACGWRLCIVVSDTGDIYTFGWNKYGQLGLGSNEDALVPALVPSFGSEEKQIPQKVSG